MSLAAYRTTTILPRTLSLLYAAAFLVLAGFTGPIALPVIAIPSTFDPSPPASRMGASGHPGEEHVILVYPFDGCRRGSSSSEGLGGVELQSPRRARDIALSELERRVNQVSAERNSKFFAPNQKPHRSLAEAPPFSSSVRLRSRYLSALQMEVTTVPAAFTSDDIVQLAADLPCVETVTKDYVKTIQDPEPPIPVEAPHRALFPRHPEAHRGNRGLRRAVEGGATDGGPDDELFPQQWHLQDTAPWSIGAQTAWRDWQGSPSMVVAIIDSGCDLEHPDLRSKLWTNTGEVCGDGIDNDQNGYVDDCYGWDWVDNDNKPYPADSGHGTAAAGIIAAHTNNGIGVAGLCWDCRIMCLRFIDGVEGRVSNQVSAIDYAAKMGAKISNNSYGGYGFSKLEYEVIRRVRAYGHLFVASAGNNNYDTDLPQYDHTPSIYNLDNILAVGASTTAGGKASFSNHGKTSVDIYAPGSRIVTTENGGGYASVSGTSFAAPMGAGAAALIWSRFPSLGYLEVIDALTKSCRESTELTGLAICGGVISISNAMARAAEIAGNKGQQSGGVPNPASPASVIQSSQEPAAPPTTSTNLAPAAQGGYTGWLGAFLSGFSKTLGRTGAATTPAVETAPFERTAEQRRESDSSSSLGPARSLPEAVLPSSYLLFSGTGANGDAVLLDPMYLSQPEFEDLLAPYERAFGLDPPLLPATPEGATEVQSSSPPPPLSSPNHSRPAKSLPSHTQSLASSSLLRVSEDVSSPAPIPLVLPRSSNPIQRFEHFLVSLFQSGFTAITQRS